MTDARVPRDGSDPETAPPSARGPRPWRIAAIAVAAVLLVGLGALALSQNAPASDEAESPAGSSSPTEEPAATPSPAPSESATGAAPGGTPAEPGEGVIPLDEAAEIAPGLSAEIVLIEAVAGTAQGPGEVAGDAIRVTVSIANTAGAEASLRTAVVSGYSGADRDPAPELREPGGRPLPASVGAMTEVDGVYLFAVPEDARDDVTIIVDYSVDVAPLVFRGDVAALMTP